jgi:hypothetical protein
MQLEKNRTGIGRETGAESFSQTQVSMRGIDDRMQEGQDRINGRGQERTGQINERG